MVVVAVLVVLLSALRISANEMKLGSEFVVDQENTISAPSPPKAVQVNVAIRISLYSRVTFIGPLSITGTVYGGGYMIRCVYIQSMDFILLQSGACIKHMHTSLWQNRQWAYQLSLTLSQRCLKHGRYSYQYHFQVL